MPSPARFEKSAVVAYAVLAAVAFSCVVPTIMNFTRVSVFDEATHSDYAWRVSEGELPRAGDPLAEPILREWACRGFYDGQDVLPACNSEDFDYSDFPGGGLQYNFSHPPLYYFITGISARIVSSVFDMHFVTSARLLGAVWLTVGLALVYRSLLNFRVPHRYALSVAVAFAFVPTVVEFSSIVTNDAAALVCGGAVALMALGVARGESGWKSVVGVTVFVILVKVMFVAALIAAAAVWAVVAIESDTRDRSRLLRMALLMALVAASVFAVWTLVQRSRGMPGYTNPVAGINTRHTDHYPIGAIVRNLFEAWPPTLSTLPTVLDTPLIVMWAKLSTLLLGAGALIVMFQCRHRLGSALSIGAAAGMLAVPVLIQTFVFLDGHQYFPHISPRYGMVLLPFLVILLAIGLQWKRRLWAATSVAVIGAISFYASVLGYMLT